MDNLTAENKKALVAAMRTIEKYGGPKWYAWCDLKRQCIRPVTNGTTEVTPAHAGSIAYSHPPAVAAAVVMYALDTIEWWWTKSYCTFMPDEVENGTWCYRLRTLGGAQIGEQGIGKVPTCIALITAVADALEEA